MHLIKLRPDLLPSREHICSHEFCQPENESIFIRRGLLNPEDRKTEDDVFVCKYGQIHQCSFEDCMANGYCPISGMSDGYISEYSSYNRHDPRTFKKDKVISSPSKQSDVYTKIESVIENILYSNSRKKINEQWYNKQMKLCKKDKDNYIQEECSDRPINLIGVMMIESLYRSLMAPLVILEFDQIKLHYYTQVVLFVYQCVQKYVGEGVKLDAVILGTLYKMQQGIRVDDTVILPVDRYLVDNLPLINDLPRFKIDKRNFTRGEKLISQMIENIKKEQIPISEIALKLDKNEEFKVFMPSSRK